MATYIKFLAGYLEKQEYRYYKKNKLTCVSKMFGATPLYLTDIIAADVASEENVKKLGGSLGGAVVGGLLLGGVGALVGGMSSGRTTESTIVCTFKNGQKSLAKVNSPMFEAIQAHLFNLAQNPNYADGTDKTKKTPLWVYIAAAIALVVILNFIRK